MNPLMLCPNPIASLQWILTVGSSDVTGVEEGLGDRKVVVGVGVLEAAGPHEVRRTRTDPPTTRRIPVEHDFPGIATRRLRLWHGPAKRICTRTLRRKSRNKVAAIPPAANAETRSVELELTPNSVDYLPAGQMSAVATTIVRTAPSTKARRNRSISTPPLHSVELTSAAET